MPKTAPTPEDIAPKELAANEAAARKAEAAKLAEQEAAAKEFAANGLEIVTVIGPKEGRWRAGFHFGANPAAVAVSEDQLALIKSDPFLSVSMGGLPEGALDIVVGAGGAVKAAERLPIEAFMDGGGCKPISVLGPVKGRRRAGMEFGKEAVTFTPTLAQLEAILGDPELSVQPA
jgi:hypothetical protein